MNGRTARKLRQQVGYKVNNPEHTILDSVSFPVEYTDSDGKVKEYTATQFYLEECKKRDYKLLKREYKNA